MLDGTWSIGHWLVFFVVIAAIAGVIELVKRHGADDVAAAPDDAERSEYGQRLVNVLSRARDERAL